MREKWDPVLKRIVRRVRGTAGGDRVVSNYNVSSSVAALVTVKILLNAVVTENTNFATIDLADFYLSADLPEPEYIKIYTDTYSPSVLSQLGITDFIHTDSSGKSFCCFAINKSMHGLKNAGRVSKDRLVKHLNSSNFFETKTPCLFRHSTRDITFCLVVDDFGIKHSNPADLSFLVDCLSQLH